MEYEDLDSITPQGSYFLTCGFRKAGRDDSKGEPDISFNVWEFETGKLVCERPGRILSFPGTQNIMSEYGDQFQKWDAQTWEKLSDFTISGTPFLVSQDGCLLMTRERNEKADRFHVWNIETGQKRFTFDAEDVQDEVYLTRNKRFFISLWCGLSCWDLTLESKAYYIDNEHREFLVTPDDRFILCWGSAIQVLDLETGRLVVEPSIHTRSDDSHHIIDVKIHPLRPEWAISIALDCALKLWEWKSGKVLAAFYTDTYPDKMQISADGKTIVCGEFNGHLHFLNLIDR
jgi:WD40 repeat protein